MITRVHILYSKRTRSWRIRVHTDTPDPPDWKHPRIKAAQQFANALNKKLRKSRWEEKLAVRTGSLI